MTCPVCTLSFTKTRRIPITCQYCPYTACLECVKRHLHSIVEPSCLACSRKWQEEFLIEFLTRNYFVTVLIDKQVDILMAQQTALLPETVHYAEHQKQIDQHLIKSKELLNERSHQVEMVAFIRNRLTSISPQDPQYSELQAQYVVACRKRLQATSAYNALQLTAPSSTPKKTSSLLEQPKYITCPVLECNGYINLNSSSELPLPIYLECSLCNNYVCTLCHEIWQDITHQCNIEIIDSVKVINEDSKQCPGCKAYIYKTTGCYQMWCTQCHTAFDWNTGLKVNERIHNPHFKEYLEQCGQTLDFVSQDDVNAETITAELHRRGCYNPQIVNIAIHVNHVDGLIEYAIDSQLNGVEAYWLQLRVRLLLGRLKKKQWRVEIKKNMLKKKRLQTKRDILRTFVLAGQNICREFVNTKKTIDETILEYNTLCIYIYVKSLSVMMLACTGLHVLPTLQNLDSK